MGKPAARVGDMHVCPMVTPGAPPVPHVGGPINPPGVPTVMIGGVPAATATSLCTCVGPPDTIALGSLGVLIGGKPAARMGDLCSHGGSISIGLPTVMIGEVMPFVSPNMPSPPGLMALVIEMINEVVQEIVENIETVHEATQDAVEDVAGSVNEVVQGVQENVERVISVASQIVSMQAAAQNGTPFCEVCP